MLNIRFYYFNLSDYRKDLCIFGVKFRNYIKWTSNFIWIVPLKRSLNCCPWLIPRQNPPCHRWLLMIFFTAQVGVDSKTITNWLLYRWFRKYRRWCQTHQLQAPFVMSGTNLMYTYDIFLVNHIQILPTPNHKTLAINVLESFRFKYASKERRKYITSPTPFCLQK